jgi:O-antigen ligase
MRRVAWLLLLLFVFAIPWEYSLDLGAGLGNVARFVGALALLAAIPAVLQSGRMRSLSLMHWVVLALFLWFCIGCFWTIDSAATLAKLRGYFQEMMILWLVWEFAETPADLRTLLRAWVAGSWLLAILSLANFTSVQAIEAQQIRVAATGQDPNDVARFLNLGFLLAALLADSEPRWPNRRFTRIFDRVLGIGYLPLGLVAVLLTASRGGFLAVLVALAGCAILFGRNHRKALLAFASALPVLAAALWLIIPHPVFERLATIPEQLQSGDLNQRINIWSAGWDAFTRSPYFGTGVGTFVTAAGLSPIDTAHNTALSIAVAGGLVAVFLAAAVFVLVVRSTLETPGSLRIALFFSVLTWALTSMVATVEENRTTWLLFAVVALSARLSAEDRAGLATAFSTGKRILANNQFSASSGLAQGHEWEST